MLLCLPWSNCQWSGGRSCSSCEREGSAADEAAAFAEFWEVYGDGLQAVLGDGGAQLRSVGAHDDGVAGADEVAGEGFAGLCEADLYFVDCGKVVEFLPALGHEGFGAPGYEASLSGGRHFENGEGEV